MRPALTLKSGGSSPACSAVCSAVCSAAPRAHGLMKRGAQLGSPPGEREMWGDVARCGEIWGGEGRYGEVRGGMAGVAACGEVGHPAQRPVRVEVLVQRVGVAAPVHVGPAGEAEVERCGVGV